MAILAKEQFESLKTQLTNLQNKRDELILTLISETSEYKAGSEDSVSSVTHDIKVSLINTEIEIRNLENLLRTAKEATYTDDEIAIGTKFRAAFDIEGEIEEDTYLLVQSNPIFGHGEEVHQVSVSSPFGASVVGKKEADIFEYTAPAGTIKGVITSIIPRKELEPKENKLNKQKKIGTMPTNKKN